MGKLKDMFNTQIKEYGNYEKKKKWKKTVPKFINYDITMYKIKDVGLQKFDVIVTNLLDIKDKRRIITKVKEMDDNGLILSIFCPFCGNTLKLNKHWNAYICCNNNGKHIFEIKDIEYERPKKIVELEEGW